ncbi:MAG: hypothetical protein Q9217_001503 [Psora testacea]
MHIILISSISLLGTTLFLPSVTCKPVKYLPGFVQTYYDNRQSDQALNSSSPSSLQLPQKSTISNSNCVDSPRWNAPGWSVEDCYSAVQQLFLQDVHNKPGNTYEFLPSRTSPPQTPFPIVYTPRKYTIPTLEDLIHKVALADLPGAKGYPLWPTTDLAKFKPIYDAARSIEEGCTLTKKPGWLQMGQKEALGVFVWATDSFMNEAFGSIPGVMAKPSTDDDITGVKGDESTS